MSENYFWGVDCGSTVIKVALLDQNKNLIHSAKGKSLFPLIDHVRKVMEAPGFPFSPFDGEDERGMPIVKKNHRVITTGYGRSHIPFADKKLTEIKAHFMGVQAQVQESDAYTIIDIGGQDSKIISVKDGAIFKFVLNRKCAAGTGAFIEELAHRLDINLQDLPNIAQGSDKKITLNSFCTVFAVSEMIKVLVSGEKLENLVKALYDSVVRRILEMGSIETDLVVFSGGVLNYHSQILKAIFEEKLQGKQFSLAPNTQFCGALGAALFGIS